MNTVLKQLKNKICEKASEGSNLRKEIHSLTWVPGFELKAQELRTVRNLSGQKTSGKKALKAFRQKDAGPKRASLHERKQQLGNETRLLLVLYGLLRGVPYKLIEPKTKNPIDIHNIYWASIHNKIEFDIKQVLTRDQFKTWVSGGPSPFILKGHIL